MLSDKILFCCCQEESSRCSQTFFGCGCWTGYKLVWFYCCSLMLMTDYCRKTKRGTAESCLCFCPQRHCIYLVSGDYITQKVVHDALNSECLLALACRELVFMSLKASGPISWNYCSPSYFVSLVFLGVTSFKLLLIHTKLHWWWEKWIMLCMCCF